MKEQVKLERFVDAYRDACCAPLDDTALKRRINRTLRERAATNRQRPWLWLFALGGMLSASLASATPAGQVVIAWLQRQLPNLEQRYEAPARKEQVPTAGKPRVAGTLRAEVAEVSPPAPSIADLAAVPATLVDADTKRLPAASRPKARVAPPVAKKAETPNELPNPVTALYERAFQLQFTQANYSAALSAWDKYLAAANNGGALLGEARFHRAVCLVALGRYGEARNALSKMVNGASGAAYRARAHTLLQALDSAEH